MRKANHRGGFTMVEILVAMLVLAIGLLGMAGMTIMMVRGNRGATDLTAATNICQMKIEELKNISWDTLGDDSAPTVSGAAAGGMAQEVNLNAQGEDKDSLALTQKNVAGSSCYNGTGVYATSTAACKSEIDAAGPFKFTRTFVVCKGADNPYPPSGTSTPASAVAGAIRPDVEPDCRVNPSNSATRSQWLVCLNSDIMTTPGTGNKEKKVKVLCAWRSNDGVCHSVHLDTTLVKF